MQLRKIAASTGRIVVSVFLVLLVTIGIFAWHEMGWFPVDVLVWHAKHGNFARVGDYNIPVSFWNKPRFFAPYSVDIELSGFDFISAEFGRKGTPGNQWNESLRRNMSSPDPRIVEFAQRMSKMKTVSLMIADQPSMCIEEGLSVRCIPQDKEIGLTVTFFGPPKRRPLFYGTLSKITRTSSNH